MEKIRRGNDIDIQWSIYADIEGEIAPYNLAGKKLSIYMKNQFGSITVDKFSVEGNTVRWTFFGKDQKQSGLYSIELIENDGKEGMHTVDKRDAFQLVHHSCETGGSKEEDLETVSIQFASNVGIVGTSVGSGLQYSEERTVYLTEIHEDGDDTLEITEEERAYNIETVNKVFEGFDAGNQKVFISLFGTFYFFQYGRISDDKKSATFGNVAEYEGVLHSMKVTITSEGDAIAEATQIKTGGSETPSDMNSDFSNDF
jgi:hypothetical protein